MSMSIQQSSKPQRAVSFGYTLIELMIVVAIVAILAAVALSSYSSYVVKTNRAAATGCISEYANYMERFYTTNLRYDEIPASGATVAAANPATGTPSPMLLDYTYSVPAPSTTGYIIQATPINAQLKRDTQCGKLTLNQLGSRTALGGTTTTVVAQCWGG
jgi:type IV pilus assembly protein PilE